MPEKAIMNKKEWEQMLKEDPILADCLFKMNIEKQINKIYYQIHWLLESRRLISTASSDDYIKLRDVTKDLNELQLDNKHLLYLKKVYKRLEKNFKKLQKSVEKEEELDEGERINNDYVSSGSDQEIKELNEDETFRSENDDVFDINMGIIWLLSRRLIEEQLYKIFRKNQSVYEGKDSISLKTRIIVNSMNLLFIFKRLNKENHKIDKDYGPIWEEIEQNNHDENDENKTNEEEINVRKEIENNSLPKEIEIQATTQKPKE
uniref:Uncharacterized protein n=1 Tax=Meloidogyne javanica TaxID=6303 RepID=A0A915NBH1_MELJA